MLFRFLEIDCDPNILSPLTLAFIGDCVFEMFVREKIVCEANRPVNKLHQLSSQQVCCKAQAQNFKKIIGLLTDQEITIYKRGRNAHSLHKPKNSNRTEYNSATGVETLFGFLYLKNEIERLRYLFEKMHNQIEEGEKIE